MTAHEHTQAGAAPPPALLVELQHDAVEVDRVVARDDALLFVTEDLVEIRAPDGHKGAGRVGGRAGKSRVVVGDELLAPITGWPRPRAGCGHPPFRYQTTP